MAFLSSGSKGINYDKCAEGALAKFFGCARKTHDPESCDQGCQFVMLEQLKKRNPGNPWCQLSPTKYPKGTFLSLAGYTEPPRFYVDNRPKKYSSGAELCRPGSRIRESSSWSDYLTDDEAHYYDDEAHYYEVPKRVVGSNPNHEVPSDFIKGTTACKEATQAGHSQEARLRWLAPAKVIEAGKSAENLSKEISKEHEIGSSKMRSSCTTDDYSAKDGLDAKEMMKLGTTKRKISKRKRSKRKRISGFDDEGNVKRIMLIRRWPMLYY